MAAVRTDANGATDRSKTLTRGMVGDVRKFWGSPSISMTSPLSDYLDLYRNKAANSTNDRVIGNSGQSIGVQHRNFDSNKDEYSVIYRDDLNGLGILSDKTILYGKNVKPEDAYMLVELERMKQEGYSDGKINVAINNYLNGHEKQYGTSSVIREGKNINYYTNFEDITDNLTKEMLRA